MKRFLFISTIMLIVSDGEQAFAYIDPTATGTMIQLLLAGGTGVLLFVQQVWKRIRARKRNNRDFESGGGSEHPSQGSAKDGC